MEFLDLAAFVKNEVFREENETRITLAVPPRGTRPVRFREASEMLIPYVQIFSGRRQFPITEVIVGPGAATTALRGLRGAIPARARA